jgi:cell division protein FtsW (lipid II flippase)
MTLPGMVVVFIIILVVFYMAGYPVPPILLRAIYAVIIILLIVIVLQAFGFLGPGPAMRITPWQEREHTSHKDQIPTFEAISILLRQLGLFAAWEEST